MLVVKEVAGYAVNGVEFPLGKRLHEASCVYT